MNNDPEGDCQFDPFTELRKPKKCGGCDHLVSCCDGSRWFCDKTGWEADPFAIACDRYENGPERRRYE